MKQHILDLAGKNIPYLFTFLLFLGSCQKKKETGRVIVDLNGQWEIEEGKLPGELPTEFKRTIPVPGIVPMAEPAFDSTGTRYSQRNYDWYRRKFTLPQNSDASVALLKVNKAKYGTKVFINGKSAGYNPWCLTPSYFNIKDHLLPAGQENDLVIRIGATEFDIPDSIPNDRTDLEKRFHYAGVYDDVKLILSGYPFIENVQIVPDIENEKVRIVAEVKSDRDMESFTLGYTITEYKAGTTVTSGNTPSQKLKIGKKNTIDFTVPMNGCQLWSPENPFLYSLALSTGSDTKHHRFGMRSFTFDPEKKMALLNGQPYAMLGTNVTVFRFFEDENRGQLPWDREWVKNLHLSFKKMNWNSIRYSIGFPPEIWYDIADETGFLLQDEYLYWYQYGVFSASLEVEFEKWMRERWNHPSVVIWDAQNETVSEESGKAIRKVRHLDLSNRPWDNGFSAPQAETDPIESHPYLFYNYFRGEKPSERGYMADFFDTLRWPHNDPNEHVPKKDGSRYENAVIINEYDWLWINRDGTPTTLTDKVYATLWGDDLTANERRRIRAENVGVLTEYWRCHRRCAAIMHFCGLTYSRSEEPRGQTSDIFLDVQQLTIDPFLLKYVKPKFAPVCVMIDWWEKSAGAGSQLHVPVHVINDYPEDWPGQVTLALTREGEMLSLQQHPINVESFGKEVVNFDVDIPGEAGNYTLASQVILEKDTVVSTRYFSVR